MSKHSMAVAPSAEEFLEAEGKGRPDHDGYMDFAERYGDFVVEFEKRGGDLGLVNTWPPNDEALLAERKLDSERLDALEAWLLSRGNRAFPGEVMVFDALGYGVCCFRKEVADAHAKSRNVDTDYGLNLRALLDLIIEKTRKTEAFHDAS